MLFHALKYRYCFAHSHCQLKIVASGALREIIAPKAPRNDSKIERDPTSLGGVRDCVMHAVETVEAQDFAVPHFHRPIITAARLALKVQGVRTADVCKWAPKIDFRLFVPPIVSVLVELPDSVI